MLLSNAQIIQEVLTGLQEEIEERGSIDLIKLSVSLGYMKGLVDSYITPEEKRAKADFWLEQHSMANDFS